MAKHKFPCRSCGVSLTVAETAIGGTVACPSCGERTIVPTPEEEAARKEELRLKNKQAKEANARAARERKEENRRRREEAAQREEDANSCDRCGENPGWGSSLVFVSGEALCAACAKKTTDKVLSEIVITTTNNVDGHRVIRYVGIESIEIVIGTGMFSELGGDISDFFGLRSTGFEKKLQHAKQTAFKALKHLALQQGANAVVGIDLDYTEFSGNRIGLIANGTLVSIVPHSPSGSARQDTSD